MSIDETRTVLKWLYAHREHPNPDDASIVAGWHRIIGDLDVEQVLDVIVDHVRSDPADLFLMPADIRKRVSA